MKMPLKAAAVTVAIGVALAVLSPTSVDARTIPRGDVSPPSTSTSTLPSGTTARLNKALLESWSHLPGGAMAAVVVPGRGRWIGTVGYANDERRIAMDPTFQSRIGSVTKTLTGMLVLKEIADGNLALDDTLDRWYPTIPKSDQITIAMLLNMSSGINDYLNSDILTTAEQLMVDPKRRYRPDALIAKGAALPRLFKVPGTQFAYSNTNTVILGRILERESGVAFSELLTTHVLTPLGLSRTFLDTAGDMEAPHAQTYSDVFSIDPNVPPIGRTTAWSQSFVWTAGGAASTIEDLARWGRALGTGRGVIPPSLAADRLDACAPPQVKNRKITVAYCLGVIAVRDTDSGRPITLWHNGRVFGSVAYVGYYPVTGAVVAIMANSDMAGPDGEAVSMRGKAAIEAAIPHLLGLAK